MLLIALRLGTNCKGKNKSVLKKNDGRFCEVAEESGVKKGFKEEVALMWNLEEGGRALKSRGLEAEGLL